MKRALHFGTKLNSRDIIKCNCFWAPSYDLFASDCKAAFLAPTATGVQRLTKAWSSLSEVIYYNKVQQSFLNQSLYFPNQKFLDPPLHRLKTLKRDLVKFTQRGIASIQQLHEVSKSLEISAQQMFVKE